MSLHSNKIFQAAMIPNTRSVDTLLISILRPERIVLFLEFYHFRGQRDLLWRPLTDDRSPSHHTQVTTLRCTSSTMPSISYIYIFKDFINDHDRSCLYVERTCCTRTIPLHTGHTDALAWPPTSNDIVRYLEGFHALGNEADRGTRNGECTRQRRRGQ